MTEGTDGPTPLDIKHYVVLNGIWTLKLHKEQIREKSEVTVECRPLTHMTVLCGSFVCFSTFLQRCPGLCSAAAWIGRNYPHSPSLWSPLPSPHPAPRGHQRARPCATWQLVTSSPFYTWPCVHVSATFSTHPSVPPQLRPRVHSLHLCFPPCR